MTAPDDLDERLAEAVPAERLEAALAAYHDSRLAVLCHDGAWEIALGTNEAPRHAAEQTHETTT